jgi:alpha-L-rhamnosidase
MNSFSHYAYGAVVGWMFEKIGGIKEQKPGFEEILIAPEIDPNLTFSDCVYKSVRGDIKTRWEKKSGLLTLSVSVPVNTSAIVKMPGDKGVSEHRVGSGNHTFTSPWASATK